MANADDDVIVETERRKLADKLLMGKNLDDELPMYDNKADSSESSPVVAQPPAPAPPSSSQLQKLSVSVISKDVQLPEREVTLAAYTVPDEKTAGPYEYSWTLMARPPNGVNGTMSDQTKDKITLSSLSEGLYQFKVVVKGKGLVGEAFGNVTVLPEKRINRPPIVVITPKMQFVKWPTSGAILDGSSSQVRQFEFKHTHTHVNTFSRSEDKNGTIFHFFLKKALFPGKRPFFPEKGPLSKATKTI